jgi:hypothetical protein
MNNHVEDEIHKSLPRNSQRKRPLRRPSHRWEDTIKYTHITIKYIL